MTKSQKILGALIALLLAAAVYGFLISREPEAVRVEQSTKKSQNANALLVDQSPLKIAQQLARLADTPEEKTLAQAALKRADMEVDQAFDSALHDALMHPQPLSPE